MAAVGQATESCDKYDVELVHYFSDGCAAKGAEYELKHAGGVRKGRIRDDGTALEKDLPKGKVTVKYVQTRKKIVLNDNRKKMEKQLKEIKKCIKPIAEKNRKLLKKNRLWNPKGMLTGEFLSDSTDINKMVAIRGEEDQFFIEFHSAFLNFKLGTLKRHLITLAESGEIQEKHVDAIFIRMQLISKNKKSKTIIINFAKEMTQIINGSGSTSCMDKRISSSILLHLFSPSEEFFPKTMLFDGGPGDAKPPPGDVWTPPNKTPTKPPKIPKPPGILARAAMWLVRLIVGVIVAVVAALSAEVLIIIAIIAVIVIAIVLIIWWLFKEKPVTREVPGDYEEADKLKPKPELEEFPYPYDLQTEPQKEPLPKTRSEEKTTTIEQKSKRKELQRVRAKSKKKKLCKFSCKEKSGKRAIYDSACNICTGATHPSTIAAKAAKTSRDWTKGNSTELTSQICQNVTGKRTGFPAGHKWFAENNGSVYRNFRQLQAHHLILGTEVSGKPNPLRIVKACGYNINHWDNGIMLPGTQELACHLGVVRHASDHTDQLAGPEELKYRTRVRSQLQILVNKAKKKKYCKNYPKFIAHMRGISLHFLGHLSIHSIIATDEGPGFPPNAFERSQSTGCQNAKALKLKKTQLNASADITPTSNCNKSGRDHQLKTSDGKPILKHSGKLEIGT